MIDETKKHIDESWKDAVSKEKQTSVNEQEAVPPEANFSFFVSTLALQISIFLGQIPNPATNKKERNLPQAKFLIDTLDLLQDKTKGNLSSEESNLLENVLYELKMQYVSAVDNKEAVK
ncbi:DUF1844 domain-containing protein [Candidatus Omnitrophota bacterium]